MLTLDKDIFFYHLPKTAGTTVIRQIEALLPAEGACALPGHEGEDEAPFVRGLAHDGPVFVHGHPDILFHLWAMAEQRTRPRFTMTFVRNPTDRFISSYYFYKRSRYVSENVGTISFSLEEAVSCGDPRLSDNMMTKALASRGRPRDYLAPATKRDLAEALAALRDMDFIGLVEQFDLGDALLGHMLGFAPGVVTRWNVNAKYPGKEELPARTTARIAAHNVLDYELYGFAAELFQAKVAEAGEALAPILAGMRVSEATYMVRQKDGEQPA